MFKEIKNFCYLKHIKESKIIKNKLLKYMEDMPLNTYEEVSKTDWGLSSDYKRPYVKYFINILKPYMQKIVKKLNTKNWLMHNMWFQQYNKNSHHTWHTHPSVQFSSVYYLELPDTNVDVPPDARHGYLMGDRIINLFASPFALPDPIYLVGSVNHFQIMALWKIEDLPDFESPK